ncbi:MAG: hypothetical protein GZ094_04950 [Mariniphaga sp.]|nr:hypothetical protein [Mariniphaga sp.]
MKTLVAQRGWLDDSDLRLDASFHLSDGQLTLAAFKRAEIHTEPLQKVSERIFYGGRSRRIYVSNPENGLPFIKGADIIKSDFSNLKIISRKRTANLKEYFLEEGWTVITRSGTIGNTAYVNKDFIGKAASDDIIRVVPKTVPSGFLYAFLSSKPGQALLNHGSYGAVIQHIEPEHIENIPVPIFKSEKQQEVHNLIIQAADLRVESNKNLNLALSYFNTKYQNYLGYQTIFSKNVKKLGFSWVGRNNDVFAEEVSEKIQSDGFNVINQIAEKVFAPPMFKHIYLSSDNGYVFYTGADLLKSFRRPSRFLSKKGVNRISDYVVNENQVLVYKSGPRDGMLGSVFLTDGNIKGSCLSDHVIRIQIQDEILRNWVFAFLKSKVGLRQLHNIATGTAILFITPERLAAMAIPRLDDRCNEISELIRKYKDLNERAFLLEELALCNVEKEIAQWQQ